MQYSYKVRDPGGRMASGQIEAENRNSVIDSLLKQNYYILSLTENPVSSSPLGKSIELGGISTRDLVIMTRQLSTMLAAGLSILRAFSILGEQTASKKLRRTILQVRDDIEEGMALWQAMSRHPRVFSQIYINMIRAGELGGVLDMVLDRLSSHMEREDEIETKVRNASIYPAVIAVFALLVVVGIITFVLPTFAAMFADAGTALPLPTRILLGISVIIKSYWYILIPGIVVSIGLWRYIGTTTGGRWFYDSVKLKTPVIGRTVSRIVEARFARTMGTLVRSGIPVLQALESVEGIAGNVVVADGLKKARESIAEGESITGPLQRVGIFEPMVTQMIAVGEETGTLDEMLVRMADYYDKEVMYMVEAMMAIVEPLLIIVVASMIGAIIVATMLPMFDMFAVVGKT